MAGEQTAAQVAAVEASAAAQVAAVTATAAATVEAAAAQVAAVQETAEQIAAAAMQTPLANRVAELEQDAETWENEQERLHESHAARLQSLESQLTETLARLATLETATTPAIVIPVAAPSTDQSLIPAASEVVPPTITEAVIVQPETLIPQPESGVTSAAPRARKTRFL